MLIQVIKAKYLLIYMIIQLIVRLVQLVFARGRH